ncbi:DUF1671-domain-containing protein [Mycena amicta]|nr:DUF1671-domain-containing protein [Mycena amicta]
MSYTLRDGRVDSSKTSESIVCAICSATLTSLSTLQRQIHYDRHFDDEPAPSTSTPKASSSTGKFKLFSPRKEDLFWYSAQAPSPPPKNFVPGLIPLLKTHLSKSHSSGWTRRAVLCYDRTVLVVRQIWDANWGCGYRNYLMACTALMDQQIQPLYFPLLDDPIPPSVSNLQRIIEEAWKAGFDPEGARQLQNLVDTKKRIGVADIQVAFTYCGIPSLLVEFDLKEKGGGADVLINWTIEYFSQPHGYVDKENARRPKTVNDALWGAAPVTTTSRMPFILQHDGHSRTIVGYEVTKSGEVNLLQFDPSQILKEPMRDAGITAFGMMTALPNSPVAASSSKRSAAASLFDDDPPPLKRSRTDEKEVIEIDDDEDEDVIIAMPRNNLNPKSPKPKPRPQNAVDKVATVDVLKVFRLQPKRIIKEKKYQVLYFPLTAPLSALEKQSDSLNGYGEKIS